ncbi:MAG: GDP-mannose 4,6-dehydratase [Ruminococcus flavefaciens]|nr:GDP-mannose 4,6-dehydratase [Ruminococcus flavefaciens]
MVSLVTGGCGFIGSHMVDRLLAEGHTVRVIDNWTIGRPENLDHQKDDPNLKTYHMDIRNREEIEPVFQNVDYVFRFAALADIVPSIQKPWEYYSSNVLGTFNVVECAKNAGIKNLCMRHLHLAMGFLASTRQKKQQRLNLSIRMH